MARRKFQEEVKQKAALEKAVAELLSMTPYPSPASVSNRLQSQGEHTRRQVVRKYYYANGIEFDKETGLWLKKGKNHA